MSSITIRRLLRQPILIVGLCAALVGSGVARAQSANDVSFLEPRSMLFQSAQENATVSGTGDQWQHHFEDPEPQAAVHEASAWLLYYPGCVIPEPGKSVIATWADPELWATLHDIGIDLLHTDPIERAGGLQGQNYTPTIDGNFDRISYEIDPTFGTEQEFRQLVQVANQHNGAVGGDLVPLHTGLGADFQLAELGYKDYPGAYTMVEIPQEDWGLLPGVSSGQTAIVSKDAATQLFQKGLIPGLINSADANPQAQTWSGWSATDAIVGVDGKTRRWVYLHVFKPQQPALNWSDPSYAGRRMIAGDAVRNIHDLGNRVVRLDAVPFLGIDPNPPNPLTSYFMTPLAVMGTNDVAFTVRKLGGFSFEELNVPVEQYKGFTTNGPDLSYDFFTRAESIHPILTRDARPLRFEHQELIRQGVKHGSLIHDLQNHDEITYQLVNLGSRQQIHVDGLDTTGQQLKDQILNEMRQGVAGSAAPYNLLYRPQQDGIATTFAGFIAPALGIHDPYHANPDQVAQIRRAHVLLVMENAMQPGVFGISAWDLVGALPIPQQSVADRTQDGDYRWIDRGGVDLMGTNPNADKTVIGLPKAQALYGPLPQQLGDPNSFANQVKTILAARKKYGIAESDMLAAPDVDSNAVVVLVMRLPNNGGLAVTAVNYDRQKTTVSVDLSKVSSVSSVQGPAHDVISDQDVGGLSGNQLSIDLDALQGRTLVLPQSK